MTARTPAQLKLLFETGDILVQTSFEDLIDSFVNTTQTTAQVIQSNLSISGTFSAATINTNTFSVSQSVSAGTNLAAGQNGLFGGYIRVSADGSANATGTAQASARALNSSYTRLAVCSVGVNDGILVSAIIGRRMTIFNRASENAKLYPETGASINALGSNNPIVVSASASLSIVYISSVQAYSGA